MPIDDIKAAQTALLADIQLKHKDVVAELTKGEKPTDSIKNTILSAAEKIAKQYHKAETKTEVAA